MTLDVAGFFDEPTNAVSYVISDRESKAAAIIDPVLDFDSASGHIATKSADALLGHVQKERLKVEWLLETHVHADHLSAGGLLRARLGAKLGIGSGVAAVQRRFGDVFNAGRDFDREGGQFDALFEDGAEFRIGAIAARVLHTPGHTPACVTYVVGDAAFVGDTLFMPDYGTARCDFPGGDGRALYRSIQKIFALPPATRLFLCHDYKAPGRSDFCWETTVAAQRRANVHVHDGVSEDDFVAMRTARDKTLAMPRLLLPSVQINMRGGELPPPEDNGIRYLKLPLDTF